jgi:hypothetical protein
VKVPGCSFSRTLQLLTRPYSTTGLIRTIQEMCVTFVEIPGNTIAEIGFKTKKEKIRKGSFSRGGALQ